MRLSRAMKENRFQFNEKYNKVILQHHNARPNVAKVVQKSGNAEMGHLTYSPDVALTLYDLFQTMAHGFANERFLFYEEIQNWIDSRISSKDEDTEPNFARKMVKSNLAMATTLV